MKNGQTINCLEKYQKWARNAQKNLDMGIPIAWWGGPFMGNRPPRGTDFPGWGGALAPRGGQGSDGGWGGDGYRASPLAFRHYASQIRGLLICADPDMGWWGFQYLGKYAELIHCSQNHKIFTRHYITLIRNSFPILCYLPDNLANLRIVWHSIWIENSGDLSSKPYSTSILGL